MNTVKSAVPNYIIEAATEYNIEFGARDDQKNWKSTCQALTFRGKVTLSFLKTFTNYEARVALKNKFGWGSCSGAVAFQTANLPFQTRVALNHVPPAKYLVLADGYLRTQIFDYKNKCHYETIVGLVRDYFADSAGASGLVFDIISNFEKCGSMLEEEGCRLRKQSGVNGFVFAGCSAGMREGKHEWKVKVGQAGKNNQEFGVISDMAKGREGTRTWMYRMSPRDVQANCMSDKRKISKVSECATVECVAASPRSLERGDVVTIQLDCDECTTRYFVNDSLVGSIGNMRADLTYYFVVLVKSHGECLFELV